MCFRSARGLHLKFLLVFGVFLAMQAGKRREDSPKHCRQAARLVWTSSKFGLEEEEEEREDLVVV